MIYICTQWLVFAKEDLSLPTLFKYPHLKEILHEDNEISKVGGWISTLFFGTVRRWRDSTVSSASGLVAALQGGTGESKVPADWFNLKKGGLHSPKETSTLPSYIANSGQSLVHMYPEVCEKKATQLWGSSLYLTVRITDNPYPVNLDIIGQLVAMGVLWKAAYNTQLFPQLIPYVLKTDTRRVGYTSENFVQSLVVPLRDTSRETIDELESLCPSDLSGVWGKVDVTSKELLQVLEDVAEYSSRVRAVDGSDDSPGLRLRILEEFGQRSWQMLNRSRHRAAAPEVGFYSPEDVEVPTTEPTEL